MGLSIQDKEVKSNSPSKTRGGAANAAGALKNSASEDASSPGIDLGSKSVSPPPPSLRATSPRAGEESAHASRHRKRVMNSPEMKPFRRELRSHGTTAEGALWNLLKRKQIAGLQFRRQYSIGHHIVDFYCPALRLAIELDGDYHYHMGMPDRDWERDRELLEKYGVKTLRFENKMVFSDAETIRYLIIQEYENHQKNSPSKTRGGAANAAGALKNSASEDASSPGIDLGSESVSPLPPSLRAPSPPGGGGVCPPLILGGIIDTSC